MDELSIQDYRRKPQVYAQSWVGKEHPRRPDYQMRTASDLVQGDGYLDYSDQSWVVKSRHDADDAVHVVSEPRGHMVNKTVVSTLQFGVPGISLDPETERMHVFRPDQIIPVRR